MLNLEKTDKEGLRKGIKKNGMAYSVRDDRSRFFFPDEWDDFMKQVKKTKRLIFETLIQTGGRIEEVVNIKPKDFDWERNNIRLRVTKIKARKKEKIGKARTLNVSEEFIRKVRKHIRKQNIGDNDLLFNITKYSVYQMMKRCLKKSSIKDDWNFSLHNIRKTNGNWLKALGFSADEICLRLGHDLNTYLRHYGSPNIFDRKDRMGMIRILGRMYGGR